MLQRWCNFSFLLCLPCFAYASQPFENTGIVRTVELGGSLVHTTTTFNVKAIEGGSNVYTIALGQNEKTKTSWIEAKIKGQKDPLDLEDLGYDSESHLHLLGVNLPAPLEKDGSVHLVLETIQTHATRPWPQRAKQQDDQSLKFDTNLFMLSPYYTAVQRTKIRSPSPGIISFTEPENLQEFLKENAAATKSGSTITYGPFHDIPPSSNEEFANKNQKTVTVHYKHDFAVLEITKLKRAAEISHWGANLNIQDEIHLHNAGPELSGHFSRLEHQSQAFYHRGAPHVLSSLTLHLPAGIRNAYYYDLIGNVSTSRLRATPSVAKNTPTNQYSVLELRPRYPLLGGWNYSFTLGWDLPLADSASWDAKNDRYIVAVPIMTLFPGAVVDDAELRIILPEGAIDIEIIPPFDAVNRTLSTHTTYLDTTGRPAITLEYKQLTPKHVEMIYVSYKVPFSAHLTKPIAVATAFLGIFTLALGARRMDLSIHK